MLRRGGERMLGDWARLAGFGALLVAAIVGSILWALNYPPQNASWSCKGEYSAQQLNDSSLGSVACRALQTEKLAEGSGSTQPQGDQDTIKTTDKLLALFTGCLVIVGIFQAYYLWGTVTATLKAAEAAQRQGKILAAVEGPMPFVVQLKFVQYAKIPGDKVIDDPVRPGPIPANCRILICIENKGRSPLRLVEVCVEKFIGNPLPDRPNYIHASDWNLVLEKGPIWLMFPDELGHVTPADLGASVAAYNFGGAFWVYGYFAYPDLLDERVERKFLARWDLEAGFVPENRARYS